MFDYDSVRWKRLARMVMRRDGYMCQLAKRYGKAVLAEVVHHIFPVDEYRAFMICRATNVETRCFRHEARR